MPIICIYSSCFFYHQARFFLRHFKCIDHMAMRPNYTNHKICWHQDECKRAPINLHFSNLKIYAFSHSTRRILLWALHSNENHSEYDGALIWTCAWVSKDFRILEDIFILLQANPSFQKLCIQSIKMMQCQHHSRHCHAMPNVHWRNFRNVGPDVRF